MNVIAWLGSERTNHEFSESVSFECESLKDPKGNVAWQKSWGGIGTSGWSKQGPMKKAVAPTTTVAINMRGSFPNISISVDPDRAGRITFFLLLPLSTMRPAQHDWKKRWDWVKNASMNIKTITGNTRGKPPDRICCSTAF